MVFMQATERSGKSGFARAIVTDYPIISPLAAEKEMS